MKNSFFLKKNKLSRFWNEAVVKKASENSVMIYAVVHGEKSSVPAIQC